MCGILALVGRDRPDAARARDALDLLTHRGPDDSGSWEDELVWLGNRRLAILDPSDAGRQPMVDRESGVVVTFNGEIFNYVELREELRALGRAFATGTDTEVLLHAYLEWGRDCLPRL